MNAESSDAASQPPSWSWLSRDHIELFPQNSIEISAKTVWFNKLNHKAEDKRQLCAYVFELLDCSMKREGQLSVLFNKHRGKIGEAWLDFGQDILSRKCVIAGRKSENVWLVLLVSESEQAQYKGVGVAEVKFHFASKLSIGKGVMV